MLKPLYVKSIQAIQSPQGFLEGWFSGITLFKDARDYQILFLSLFLFVGIGTRDWTLRPDLILVIFASCLLTQVICHQWTVDSGQWTDAERRRNSMFSSLRSAAITSLGLCLLLRAEQYETMILAGVLAIASKFLFRFLLKGDSLTDASRHKHWFNPANFGIVAALTLTNDAWVSPGQWGDEIWYVLLFLGAGGVVLKRVGRWDTSVAFLGSYAFLEAVRNYWLGWTWDVLAHRLMSGSLLLFALFMITDPRSMPNARAGRLVWAVAIALLTFILRNNFYLSTAPFWALFALSPFTIILDRMFKANRFSWSSPWNRVGDLNRAFTN
jgi:Na+-transporting NADH:ubiquinone oxidoreductase subunit NqrB